MSLFPVMAIIGTLAAASVVEVQAKQLDDCAVRGNRTTFVAVRLY
jgi:hypothetical protein